MLSKPSLLALLLVPLTVVGCSSSDEDGGGSDDGGSGDGGSDEVDSGGDGGSDAEGTEAALFFLGSLNGVDPRSPTAITTLSAEEISDSVTSAVDRLEFLPGIGSSGLPAVRGLSPAEIVFGEGNVLRRVNVQLEDGEAPVATDLATFAAEIVSVETAADATDPSQARVIVTLDGGEAHAVDVGGTSTLLPGTPLQTLIDYSDGSLLGLLVHNGVSGDLNVLDLEGNAQLVGDFSQVALLGDSTLGGSFLSCDQQAHFLEHETGSLMDLGLDLSGFDLLESASEGEDLLLLGVTGPSVSVDRLTPTGTYTPLFQVDDGFANPNAFGQSLDIAAVDGDRIVFSYDAQSLQSPGAVALGRIRSIDEDGSDPVLLTEVAPSGFRLSLDAVYYTETDPVTFLGNLVALSTTGTEIFRENGASLAGHVYDEVDLGGTPRVAKTIFLREPMSGPKRVIALDRSDFSERDLGALPPDVTGLTVNGFYGKVLGAGFVPPMAPDFEVDFDVFYLDTETTNSLVRVTQTTGDVEFPVSARFSFRLGPL